MRSGSDRSRPHSLLGLLRFRTAALRQTPGMREVLTLASCDDIGSFGADILDHGRSFLRLQKRQVSLIKKMVSHFVRPVTVWDYSKVPEYFRGIAPLAFIIMGVSGSGKSTLGAELARLIGCSFLDGDSFHSPEAIAKMRSGEPLTDADRWPWLDSLAHAVDGEIAKDKITVAACSALRKIYRDRLRDRIGAPTCFVLLDVGQEELLRRLSNRSGHYMPPSLLASQLDTLERPTPGEAVITLNAGQPPADLCDQIIAHFAEARAAK